MNTRQAAPPFDGVSYAVLVLLSMCFGSTFIFQKFALEGFDPLTASAWRLITCAAALVPAAIVLTGGLPAGRRLWQWAGFNGVIGFVMPFYLTMWAQQYLTTNLIGVVHALIPLMILGLSAILLGVRISMRKWSGIALGTAGLMVLAGPHAVLSLNGQTGLLPLGGVVLATICLAGVGVSIRKMPAGPPIAGAAAASLVAAVISSPIAFAGLATNTPSWPAVAAIVASGVISTALGQYLRFFLIRRRGPVFLAPNAYLAAMFATFLGVSVLGESVAPATVVGFIVIMLGLFISQDGTGMMRQA